MNQKLFGSSGIRGIVNRELTPVLATEVGLAVATYYRARESLVAKDTRLSGTMLKDAVVSGLLAAGSNVTNVGVVPTPVVAFSTRESKANVGIMITASHNPPQYNGIKVFNADSMACTEKDQNEIERIIKAKRFKFADWQNIGRATSGEKSAEYVEILEKTVKLRKKWHVLVDPGCGATYALAPAIFKRLGCKVTALNAHPDGFFSARSPEPNAETLQSTAVTVKRLNADVGFAYDGDGDRVAIINERGVFVDFDRALAAYAGYVARVHRGGTFVTNVEASMCFDIMVEAQGGKTLRTKVGDVYLAEDIKRHNGIFGGEPCGAWIHPQMHYCPDGILSSALFLKALEDEEKSPSEFAEDVPQYSTLRDNVQCPNEAKHKVILRIGEELKKAFPKYKRFSAVDGARLETAKGWILVRASGTEPLVRLTVEGESLKATKEIMEKSRKTVKKLVKEMGR